MRPRRSTQLLAVVVLLVALVAVAVERDIARGAYGHRPGSAAGSGPPATGGQTLSSPRLLPSPPSIRTVRVPSSIDPTGKTDVTTALNAFLARVPDRSTVVLAAGARYRAEGTVSINSHHALTLEGDGATLFAVTTGVGASRLPGQALRWPRNRSHILVTKSANVRIEGLSIVGPNQHGGPHSYNPALEAQHGVDIEASTEVAIVRDNVSRVYGDFVYVSGGSSAVQILDNTFSMNGRQGVSVTNGVDVLIHGNRMTDIGRSAIDLEPGTAAGRAQRVTVSGNEIANAYLAFVAAKGVGPNVDDVTVADNDLVHMPMSILVEPGDGARRDDWTIVGNRSGFVFGSPLALMRFTNVYGITIEDNSEPLASDRPSVAVYLQASCDWAISGNYFPGDHGPIPEGSPGACPWR